MSEIVIALQGVTKEYGRKETGVRAVDGVSLHIESGEFVAIMGKSPGPLCRAFHFAQRVIWLFQVTTLVVT